MSRIRFVVGSLSNKRRGIVAGVNGIFIDEHESESSSMNTQSALLARRALAGALLGQQYEGARNVYEAAGYPKTLTFEHFYGLWQRGDIAARIIEAPAKESWRKPPTVLDGPDAERGRDTTAFAKSVKSLAAGRATIEDEFLGLWQVLAGTGRAGGHRRVRLPAAGRQ